jgi:hypothetical protein
MVYQGGKGEGGIRVEGGGGGGRGGGGTKGLRAGSKKAQGEERRDITANTFSRFQGNPGVMRASYAGQHRWLSY